MVSAYIRKVGQQNDCFYTNEKVKGNITDVSVAFTAQKWSLAISQFSVFQYVLMVGLTVLIRIISHNIEHSTWDC